MSELMTPLAPTRLSLHVGENFGSIHSSWRGGQQLDCSALHLQPSIAGRLQV